jgi:hypothetical protein
MFTFIISVALVSFICLCFFKKSFWENRYLVLLISGAVALVATITINFSVRGKLQTKSEITYTKVMAKFYMPQDLVVSNFDTLHAKLNSIKHYDWYGEHHANEFYKDTTKKQVPVTITLYSYGKKLGNRRVGVMSVKGNQDSYDVDAIYFVKSSADTIAYVSKKRLYYDVKPNNWITGFSLPRKSTITILHVPPREFAMIPDSLIRSIPF